MNGIRKAFDLLGLCLRNRRRTFLLTFAAVLGTNLLDLSFPKIMQLFVDSVTGRPLTLFGLSIPDNNPERLWIILPLVLGVLALIRWGVTFLRTMLAATLGQGALFELRSRVFNTIQSLSFAYHDRHHSGSLVSNVVEDVNHASNFFQMGLFGLFESTAYITIGTIIVGVINPPAGAVALTAFLLFLAANLIFINQAPGAFLRTKRLFAGMVGFFSENLEGFQVVRAFGCRDRQNRRNRQFVRDHQDAALKETTISMIHNQSLLWPAVIAVPLGLAAAIYGHQQGWSEVSEGRLLLIFVIQEAIIQRCRMLTHGMVLAMRFRVTAERLDQLFSSRDYLDEHARPIVSLPEKPDIVLENVSFGYGERSHSLKDISLRIRQGETVGIVGPTGAGKSTLALLLSRFYDADQGIVLLGGNDIRQIPIIHLRQMFSFVFQETFLFSASVRDNIRFGKPAATDEAVAAAARMARADTFINQLSDGYDTVIGERGMTLSGGQKQRLSIARAILQKPQFLIFDACTSAVDAMTEREIQEALQTLDKTCSIIIIAQRYSSIARADRIFVLDQGHLVAEGPPRKLRASSPVFRRVLNVD